MTKVLGFEEWGSHSGVGSLKAASAKVAKHEEAYTDHQRAFISFEFDIFGVSGNICRGGGASQESPNGRNVVTPESIDVIFLFLFHLIDTKLPIIILHFNFL